MRLLLSALGVWAAEGCKELGGGGLGILELGLRWGRALALEIPLVGSPCSPANSPVPWEESEEKGTSLLSDFGLACKASGVGMFMSPVPHSVAALLHWVLA